MDKTLLIKLIKFGNLLGDYVFGIWIGIVIGVAFTVTSISWGIWLGICWTIFLLIGSIGLTILEHIAKRS